MANHGSVMGEPGQAVELGKAEPRWFEEPHGRAPFEAFALDLRARRVPPAVHEWVHGPITTRGPDGRGGSVIAGGSAAEWLDVVIHLQVVHAAHAT
jgi:hypothetical protein